MLASFCLNATRRYSGHMTFFPERFGVDARAVEAAGSSHSNVANRLFRVMLYINRKPFMLACPFLPTMR